jgi:SAM-dependent methyltransferase
MRGWLNWKTNRTVTHNGVTIKVAEGMEITTDPSAGNVFDKAGIRPRTPAQLRKARLLQPIYNIVEYPLIGHAYSFKVLKEWVRQWQNDQTVFMDMGAGSLLFRDTLRKDLAYNAMDWGVSEYVLQDMIKGDQRVNFLIGSSTALPLDDNSVNLLVACEMLQCIPDIESVFKEMSRVVQPGGRVLVSIGNGYCNKWEIRGLNSFYAHRWTFDAFKQLAEKHGFSVEKSMQYGKFLNIPKWISAASLHWPSTSRDERLNCYFLYALKNEKK